jgi:DNA repair exonuclease SbcCD ATPase subunit
MIDFFRYTVGSDSCTVQYEEWFNDPSVNIKKLRNFLDLRWEQTELDLDLAISGIVDQALRHDDPSQREADQPPVRLLYNLARRADHDNAAREQLRLIVSQFISFQQFQRPFHRAFENLSRLAANLPPIEQEAAALRAALHERDTTVDAANEKASATEARLAVSVAENEAQRAHLGAIERELADRNAMATALQAEIQTLRNALTAAERREQERDATVEALRNALGRAELKGAEAGAVAETMRAEIGSLHRSLAQAEARGREGEAAAAARQAQIRSLQSELAAARDVGKAALVSLRITPAPILPSARDTGWLGVMLRRFGRSVNYPLPSAG